MLRLTTEVFGNVVVVHSPEELGHDQVDDLRQFFSELPERHVVLDLDATESLDSAGLSTLLDVRDALRARDGELKIATANATNLKILEMTRLDLQMPVFDSVLDAVQSFR